MPCMQNNYQQRENSDSLILVELLMLSCTLMSFRHVWNTALGLDTSRYNDLLDPTMRSSPGAALGHNQGVVRVPNVEKMMMFKWLWDHFLWGLIASWPHIPHVNCELHMFTSCQVIIKLIIYINFIFPTNYNYNYKPAPIVPNMLRSTQQYKRYIRLGSRSKSW